MTQELSKSVFRLCFFLLLYKLFNLLYIEDTDENIAKNALDIFYDFLIVFSTNAHSSITIYRYINKQIKRKLFYIEFVFNFFFFILAGP